LLAVARSTGALVTATCTAANAHIDGGDLVLFDTEFARPGPRVYDVATFRWSLAWNNAEDGSHWDDFMGGYRSVRPAPDLDLVPLLVAARCVWLLGHWAGVESLEPNSVLMPRAWVSRLVGLSRRFTVAN
jgi:Ser/Thr protein kinase RdoA (MazF antagonist)